jgi:hypothetical protein
MTMTRPLVRLIMRMLNVSEDVALIVLGYIPVRRRLNVTLPVPDYGFSYFTRPGADNKTWRGKDAATAVTTWGYFQ